MKKVKVDDKSKFLSAVFIVIVLVGVAFFLGYRKLEDKAAALNTENNNLRTRIASLKTYYDTEAQNKKDTETMTNAIVDIFSQYEGDVRFEDGIYEAFSLYGGSKNTLQLEKIVFSNKEVVKAISQEVVAAAQIEGYDQAINFTRFDVTYEGMLTYDGLKGMVREIAGGDYNLAIARMNYKINESAFIEGKSGLSFYYVTGANLDYQEPPVSAYETGLENLFGVSGAVIQTEEEE